MADWTPQSRVEEILFATINGEPYDGLPQSRIEELLLELKAAIESGGGGGGTTNYNLLSNLPSVNDIVLKGNKTAADLSLVLAEVGKGLSTNDYSDEEKAKVANLLTAIQSILDGSDIDSFGDVEIALLDKANVSDLGTAAAKDSTNAVTAGSTDLVESGAVKDAIDAAVSSAYHHAGTKTVAQLTHDLLVAANEGNVYNITDSGTTTSDFIEGIGKTIDDGSNVGICKVGNTYMFDLLSGFVDTSNFVQKSQTAGLLKNDGTVDTTIQGDVSTLKSGFTNLDNEVNGDATVYPYADVITIPDAIPANVADCTVKIEPDQDLHGYDHPWVGGSGKNMFINSNQTYQNAEAAYDVFSDERILGTATGTYYLSFEYKVLTAIGNSQSLFYGKYNGSRISGGNISSWVDSTVSSDWISKSFTLNLGDNVINGIELFSNNVLAVRNIMISATPITAFEPYENICPISGHTEASVEVSAPNRYVEGTASIKVAGNWDTDNTESTQTSSDYTVDGNTLSGTSSGYRWMHIPYSFEAGKTVYLRWNNTLVSFRVSGSNGAKKADSSGGTYTPSESFNGFIDRPLNPQTINNMKFGIGYTDDFDIDAYNKKPIQTYTIALGDTIYGGTVNFKTGVMTVTHKFAHFTDLTRSNNTLFYHILNDPCVKNSIDIICDREKSAAQWGSVGVYSDGYGAFMLKTATEYSSASDCLAAYDGEFNICYPLATPFTVQLTPTQIQLLKGTNTLTASTGQISVTANGVSGAIGSLTSDKQDKTDYALETTAKTVVGGINELASSLTALNVVLVASSSATGTYSDKLAELITAYNSLSDTRKQRSYIMVGDVRYNITSMGMGSYNAVYMSGSTRCVISILDLIGTTPVLRRVIIDSTDGVSIVDRSSTEDATVFSLYA